MYTKHACTYLALIDCYKVISGVNFTSLHYRSLLNKPENLDIIYEWFTEIIQILRIDYEENFKQKYINYNDILLLRQSFYDVL